MRMPRLAPVLALAALGACGGDGPTGGAGAPLPPLLLGGDISALGRIEQGGGTFRDGDLETNAIAAMRAHGSNMFRLRLFLAPNGDEVQVNDLAYTVALAKRVRQAGGALMLDLHYSDTWADPGHQVTPAAWSALDIDALEDTVEAYTSRVLDTLRANGALPRIVQVGNEIDGGLLWPIGRIGSPTTNDAAAYARLGRLLRAGVRGVRDVTTATDSVRVMLHFSQGANAAATQWFFDIVQGQDVDYDLIGLSFYPFWHGTMAQLQGNLVSASLRYGKDVIVVETAYPWRAGWDPGNVIAGTMIWPTTPDGQRAYLGALVAAVAAVPEGRGRGVLWWYPESIQVPGLFVWGGGAAALFDANGRILPAASVFQAANAMRQ